MKFFHAYFQHLAENPERADSLLLTSICTVVLWILMFRMKQRMIKGMEGLNLLWEGGEQVTFYSLIAFIPILFRTAYFPDASATQMIALYIVTGLIAYQVFGRYIFDWALAFKGGLSSVPEQQQKKEPTTVNINTKVETQ
ncbi:MAG TPA: hypothetical protein VK508_01710 [Cyclobacteriaceae bacterium]|nr:hypothetical protein [Cyclobacteriaceae bacterium]